MFSLCFEITNVCSKRCLHCLRDKLEPPASISLSLMEKVLAQARELKIREVSLTGGEVTLHPQFQELIEMVTRYDFRFRMMTNGLHFRDKLLPLLKDPRIANKLGEVCFSLDGATAATHDPIRGTGSFKEVMEAVTLCRLKNIPFGLKSIVSNINKNELDDLVLLGATMGARHHNFIALLPTPTLIRQDLIPSPQEIESILIHLMRGIANAVKTTIKIDAFCPPTVVFWCNAFSTPNVDYHGNLTFCCTPSHYTNDEQPPSMGGELLADLNKESLSEGICRHFDLLAAMMRDRIRQASHLSFLTYIPCYWCLQRFNKLDWLKKYPESPWATALRDTSDDK